MRSHSHYSSYSYKYDVYFCHQRFALSSIIVCMYVKQKELLVCTVYKEFGSVVTLNIAAVAFVSGARKLSMISTKLLWVPVTKPKPPITISTTLRITTQLKRPNLSGYNTQISIMDGNAMPSTDKQSAPNNEMNNAKRGTEIAKKTFR